MKDSKKALAEMETVARKMKDQAAGTEEILEALREMSPSIIQSIKTVRDVLNLSLSEAKHLVHYSRTWSDLRDPISELHEQAETVAEEYGVKHEQTGHSRIEIDLKKRE